MADKVSPSTHLLVWHTSPEFMQQEIEAQGIPLFREYIWCSMNPWMPTAFAKKFTGDFVLSAIALPRNGQDRFWWAETQGHPDGDPGEKTYDHGGGYSSEVKLWTRISRHLIYHIWTQDEVYDITHNGEGGSLGLSTSPRVGIDIWTPGIKGFAEICAVLLVDDSSLLDVRLHAGLYLRSMRVLSTDPETTTRRQQALLDILHKSINSAGDKLAVTCHLLADIHPFWMREFLLRTYTQSVPINHIARVCAFATLMNPEISIVCLQESLLSGVAKVLMDSLLKIVNSKGTDQRACDRLASLGEDVSYILVDVLLGLPLSNAVSNAIIKVLGMMSVEVSTPALIALLRRRRDISSKARGTINEVLSVKLPHSEKPLLHLARTGHWHSRRAARQILLHHGSQYSIQQVKEMLVYDDTETIKRR